MVYSAAVTDSFIRDTEEVNAISPTRIAIEQNSSHVYLVHGIKKRKCFHVSTLYFAP